MKFINWFEPDIKQLKSKLLSRVLKSNFVSEGNINKILETKIGNFLKSNNVVMTSSGTSALYLALRSINVKPGDEVIVPNITYVATLNSVKLTGAKPIIVDVGINTSTIDEADLKRKITKKTKAIIFVHVSGRSGNLKKIISLAKKKGIKIIEDAAEAFGSQLNKKYLGTYGDLGCFSFTPTKIITSAQGGAVVTNNKKYATVIRFLKDQGRTKKNLGGNDRHDLFGGNYKYNDILASVLIPQLNQAKYKLRKAKKINNFYKKNLKKIKEINFYQENQGEVCIWTEIIAKNRDKLFNYLLKNKIKCRKIWMPLTEFKNEKKIGSFKNSILISKNVMWLPSSLNLSKKELKIICSRIKKFYQKKGFKQ